MGISERPPRPPGLSIEAVTASKLEPLTAEHSSRVEWQEQWVQHSSGMLVWLRFSTGQALAHLCWRDTAADNLAGHMETAAASCLIEGMILHYC